MKVTNVTSNQLGNNSSTQAKVQKAIIGGGAITTLAVAAHARKSADQTQARTPAGQRYVVIGGGAVTSREVATHMRNAANRTYRPHHTDQA